MTTDYWNSRATLGNKAGTQDTIASELERRAIAAYVQPGMRVLDVGCGNGETACWLAEHKQAHVCGTDYSPAMVEEATKRASALSTFRPFFVTVDVTTGLEGGEPHYDLAYSQRCLINLPDWSAQEKAIRTILELVKPGGCYLMIENSQDGLDDMNDMRETIGLPRIVPPAHNRYIRDEEVWGLIYDLGWVDDGAFIHQCQTPLGTYYYLSRIVNAHLAQLAGMKPDYDSPINRLALRLPPMDDFGQGRLWVWRKT